MGLIPITHGLTPANVTAVKDAVEIIRVVFAPWVVNFTDEEIKKYFKLGYGRESFSDKIMVMGEQHDETVPVDINIVTVRMLFDFHKDLQLIKTDKSDVDSKIDNLQMNVGILLMNSLNRIYNTAKELAEKGNYPFNELVKEAGKICEKSPKSSGTLFTIEPGSQMIVKRLMAKNTFIDSGTTVLAFTWADEVSGKFRKQDAITVNPGNSEKIPKGYTSIAVFNMSADQAGSFTVKIKK